MYKNIFTVIVIYHNEVVSILKYFNCLKLEKLNTGNKKIQLWKKFKIYAQLYKIYVKREFIKMKLVGALSTELWELMESKVM